MFFSLLTTRHSLSMGNRNVVYPIYLFIIIYFFFAHTHDMTPFLLIFYSFDGSPGGAGGGSSVSGTSGGKSTKGASKMRRDLINSEIANLRDLLPLPSSTRQRLSQLQLMALVLVYVRKSNYFDQGKCKQ